MTEVVRQVGCWRISLYCVTPQQCYVLYSVQWPVGLSVGTKSRETGKVVSEWEQTHNIPHCCLPLGAYGEVLVTQVGLTMVGPAMWCWGGLAGIRVEERREHKSRQPLTTPGALVHLPKSPEPLMERGRKEEWGREHCPIKMKSCGAL